MVVPSFDYYEKPTDDQRNPWWKSVVPGVSFITILVVYYFAYV